MANIRRQKEISLAEFDSNWVNSKIFIATKSYIEIQEYHRNIRKLNSKLEAYNRDIDKLSKQIEEDSSPKLLSQLADANKDAEDVGNNIVSSMSKLIKECFVSGTIYDYVTKKEVQLKSSDLDAFDPEIIQVLAQHITGTYQKKD